MVQTVEFGSRDAARQVRQQATLRPFLAPSDDARTATVRLQDDTPQRVLTRISNMAAESKQADAEQAGQAQLTASERERIDFSKGRANVPHARSVKALARKHGVDDWTAYYDPSLTVDEHRQVMQQAARDERGRSGLGRDPAGGRAATSRAAQAFQRQQDEQVEQAKPAAFQGDRDAQGFLRERRRAGEDVFDIAFREGEFGQPVATGQDADRLEDIHEQRSKRARAIDERRSAPETRDPLEWVNAPSRTDFPGVDTPKPRKIHASRSQRARTIDEQRDARRAESVEQWVDNPDEFDLPDVDDGPGLDDL